MPRFVSTDDTLDIHAEWWAEKETATIRRFNYGDRRYLAAQTMKVGSKPGEAGISELQIERMNLAILERGLVRWTDEDGKRATLSPKTIKALESRDAEFMLAEINEFNREEERTPEEQDDFRDEPGSSLDDGERSTD